ncbi:MAG: peptide ABC transporter substrate-binding protein [Spirochaetia bacterium]|nr:peptide ABC transporter substrate-binding protein [Spirochaetia bacterium]
MKKIIVLVVLLCLSVALFATGTKEASVSTAPWQEKGTPLSDVRVRQALLLAIDMQTIVDELFEGMAERAIAMTSPGAYLAEGLESYDYDPQKAKALLEAAQWPKDYTLDVVYYYSDQQTVDLMAILQQYWAAVGVKSSFRKLEGDLSAQLWTPPADRKVGPSEVKWDLAYAAVAALSENEFYDRFESTASNNSTIPYQEGLDELVQATRATADVQKQIEAFKALQRKINENMYNIPLYHQLSFIYISDKVDLKQNALGNDQFSYEKNILDWTTSRPDGMIYSNGGPMEFYEAPVVNPGLYLYQEILFDKLINADENLTPTEGMLAKSYSVSDDGMQITFDLRTDVRWHDGRRFSADDVVFTFEYLMKAPGLNAVALNTLKSIAGANAYLEGKASSISGVKVAGNTITVTFETLDPNALLTFSQWPILPKHLLVSSNPVLFQQNAFWQNPIGTGPFKVAQTVMDNYAILERNADYYRTGSGNIKKIYLHANKENDGNLIKNAESGRIDYAWSKSVADAQAIEKIAHMTVTPVNIRYTRLFWVNQYPHPANK